MHCLLGGEQMNCYLTGGFDNEAEERAEENCFQGELVALEWSAYDGSYKMWGALEEVSQSLSINEVGEVDFKSFCSKDRGLDDYLCSWHKTFVIEPAAKMELFEAIAGYFRDPWMDNYGCDVGNWTLCLVNDKGRRYHYTGIVYQKLTYQGRDLSVLMRKTLNIKRLFAFNMAGREDVIEGISLHYTRSLDAKRNYEEMLNIDVLKEIVCLEKRVSGGREINLRMQFKGEVKKILAEFYAPQFMLDQGPQFFPDDFLPKRRYDLTIHYEEHPDSNLTGPFNKPGLPFSYPDFAKALNELISDLGNMKWEILNPIVYQRSAKRGDQVLACQVHFKRGDKLYTYLGHADNMEIGDDVRVPVTGRDHLASARVIKMDYVGTKALPLPLDEMREIALVLGPAGYHYEGKF